jgi:replicative DNA helicase
MRLPDPAAFPGILDRFGISNPEQRSLLWAASELYDELNGESNHPENRDLWQTAEALWLAAGFLPPVFHWPWPTLERIVGATSPGEVWVIGARTGDGKSTIVANLIRLLGWTQQVRITTAPLEVSPASLKLRLACLELGWPVKAVVRGEWWHAGAPTETDMRSQVRAAIQRQGESPIRDWARYCPAETMDREGLAKLVAEAAEWHHRLVIIDHIHHMEHGDGPENRGIRDTMKFAKKLARQHDLVILFTAQLGRGDVRDRKRKFYPPELTDLQGASAIEQVADGVLLLYQPLLAGTKESQVNDVLTGAREYRSVFKPNTMAAKVGKHRLDGETAKNQVAELKFQCGAILEPGITYGDAYEPERVA